jgi:hypothetical protein
LEREDKLGYVATRSVTPSTKRGPIIYIYILLRVFEKNIPIQRRNTEDFLNKKSKSIGMHTIY